MTTKQVVQQALEALEGVLDKHEGLSTQFWSCSGGVYEAVACNEAIEALKASLAQQGEQGEQQPVAWLPSVEWTPCVKLPVTVHVRQQRHGETHVSTREGITSVKPDDLIMRGVSGEEYPIGREIFEKTYRMGEAAPAAQPDTRKVIEQMVVALEIAERHLAYIEITEAKAAGQKWLKENK